MKESTSEISKLNIKLKKRVRESCTLPFITYGAQTWALTNSQIEKIRCTQKAMERSLLGVKKKDRIRNTIIREKTNPTDIGYRIKKLKWKYAGHVIRRKGGTWENLIVNWTPYGNKRRKGRPMRRWEDEFVAKKGPLWKRIALDRKIWKKSGKAYAQKWAGIAAKN